MNYVEPEIAVLASASTAIQGGEKARFSGFDSIVGDPRQTLGAYEADE
jgi:hypothetical protein